MKVGAFHQLAQLAQRRLRDVFVGESDSTAKRDDMDSTALFRPVGQPERSEMTYSGPKTCIEQRCQLRGRAGVNNFICWSNLGGLSQEVVEGSMRLFADEVIPALREDVAPAVSVAS